MFFSLLSCSDSPDQIVVRDGLNATSTVIAQFCNDINQKEVLSSGNLLYIEFISDDQNQRQGFAATFRFESEGNAKHLPSTPNNQPSIPGKTQHSFY